MHLHFQSRQELIDSCKQYMMIYLSAGHDRCQQNLTCTHKATELSMLYAGIDCGIKYAFLHKLYGKDTYSQVADEEKNATFDTIKLRWFKIVVHLQKEQIIHNHLSIAWIFMLFGGMITNAIDAV